MNATNTLAAIRLANDHLDRLFPDHTNVKWWTDAIVEYLEQRDHDTCPHCGDTYFEGNCITCYLREARV